MEKVNVSPPSTSYLVAIGSVRNDIEVVDFNIQKNQFKNRFTEIGFVSAIGLSLFIGEYLSSGFTDVWPVIRAQLGDDSEFDMWPAALLSLLQCAFSLPLARCADMYGGHIVMMSGLAWLVIWTLVEGFGHSLILLDICRSMEGIALAAFWSAFLPLVTQAYPETKARNRVLVLCGACASVGFYGGIAISSAIPESKLCWFPWTASIIGSIALMLCQSCKPMDNVDRSSSDMQMDWLGTVTSIPGLFLLSFCLSSSSRSPRLVWKSAKVLGSCFGGITALMLFVYIQIRKATTCPLLPLTFFHVRGVKTLLFASMCLYSCFGVWLYTTTAYLEDGLLISRSKFSLWYLPIGIGGLVLPHLTLLMMSWSSLKTILMASALALVSAPLLVIFSATSQHYLALVVIAMVCGTFGVEPLYTTMNVFLSETQPLHLQGLAGAVASLAFNVAVAFGLTFAQLIDSLVDKGLSIADDGQAVSVSKTSFNPALYYASISAGVGFVLILIFITIPRAK